MNREKELVRNTIILTFGKICTQFISFLLLPLYTALLMPEELGVIDLFNTIIALLTPIINWQFESGLFRFMIDFRDNKDKQKLLFSTVFIINILQAIGYMLLFVIFQGFILSEYKWFLAVDVVANIFLNTLLQFARGLGNNVAYSVGSFLSATCTVVLNVLFIAVFRWGVYGMFFATVIAKLITCVYLYSVMKTWSFFSIHLFKKELFMDVLKYSLPLVPNQLSWWVVGVSDRIIISRFISIAANGIYYVANKFSTVFVMFYNIFNLSWTESVALHMNDDDRDEFLTDTINTMFNLFAAVDIGIIACMPFVFGLMVNEQYNDAYWQIPILMIAVLFQVIVGLYSVIYVALKKSTEIAKTSFWAATINVVINLLLIKKLGLYAASMSTLVAYSIMALYRYFDVKKYVVVCLHKRNLMITILISIMTLITYYLRNLNFCLLSLIIVVIYSVLINKQFICSILRQVVTRMKKE